MSLRRTEGSDRLRELAADHGLDWLGHTSWPGQSRPWGLATRLEQVVQTTGEPLIQFGNSGSRRALYQADFTPGRRGYVAVRHDLDLPQLYHHAGGVAVKDAAGLAQTGIALGRHLWDFVALEREYDDRFHSRAEEFRKHATRLDLPAGTGFGVWCQADRASEGQRLVTDEVVVQLTWLNQWFEVENHDGWLLAHCNHGDLVVEDRARWEWMFCVASALVELIRCWGADPEFGADWPQLTSERPGPSTGTVIG